MAWIVQNRLQPPAPERTEPFITDDIRRLITERYFPRYPTKRAALLPLFHEIMHTYGYIAPQAIEEAAALLEIPAADVQDAVSFYEEFRFQPTGKYVVNVCRSIACELCGYEQIKEKIRQVFGIDPGETSDDGRFTFFEVECLGLCEHAPAALINGQPQHRITPEAFAQTLRKLPATPGHSGNGQH